MIWSWKIGEFLGIGVYMHATFPLLLAFIALPALLGGDVLSALSNVFFVLVLFVCVVLHEYGHALAARRYGIKTQDITLLPIGGVARLERMPQKPSQELVVAAAGPMVNVLIAGTLFSAMTLAGATIPAPGFNLGSDSFLAQLLTVNIVLIVFNLIPAFPMDGGRILRALLAMRLDYAQATRYAALIGQGIAVLFGIVGFFVNPLLVVTAFFIFFAAGAESEMAQERATMANLTVGQAMRTNIRALAPYEWLSHAVDHIMATGQQDFPIVENGRVVGMLTRSALMRGLQQYGPYAPISAVMQANVPTVEADEPLADASEAMQEHQLNALPVTHHGVLVGLLTFEGIRELLRLQAVLKSARNPGATRVV
jgi:Zn-dependent protease/predicted transcriptional regulator